MRDRDVACVTCECVGVSRVVPREMGDRDVACVTCECVGGGRVSVWCVETITLDIHTYCMNSILDYRVIHS